jgi:hypothetical protein
VIGEALAVAATRLGDDATRVLARLGGPLGDDARRAASQLARQRGDEHKATRASWAAIARAPAPPGLRGVHPSWIEAALDELPPRARTAVAAGGGAPVDVWLARRACAGIPEMPPVRRRSSTWPSSVDAATTLDAGELQAWLERVGFDQLAIVTAQAGGIDAAAAALGTRGDDLRAAVLRIARPPRAGSLGPARAAALRCRGLALDPLAIALIGARSIAPHVAMVPLARRRLALRLPVALGRRVEHELASHANSPVDQCPTWTALAAD